MKLWFWKTLYSGIAAPFLTAAAHVIALGNKNLQEGLQGRKGLWQRLESQLAQRRPEKPLIWFHVASAGEFLQAQPVLERFLRQEYDCAVTFSSVNGYKWIQRTTFPEGMAPLIADYLPLDTASNMRRILLLFQPSTVIYVQYDLWPNLLWEAHAAGVPQYLISATIQPKSKRYTSALSRSLYRTLYACLNGIFCVTEDDRQRFLSTNPEHPNIQVFGNTRFDSVLDRKKKLSPPAIASELSGKFVFIVGSSWPPDERCIFPALKEALEHYEELIVILAPHEPTEEHLKHGETFFQEFSQKRLTQFESGGKARPRVIMVDTIGVLSGLYSVADLAYVGGAFTTGVHNVMEPAAMGLPVLFGPKYENASEAVELRSKKLAFSIASPADFHRQLFELLEDREKCRSLGVQAQQYIESQAGVANRCFSLISGSLP